MNHGPHRGVIFMLLGGLGGAVVAGDDEALASDLPHQFSGPCTYVNGGNSTTTVVLTGEGAYEGLTAVMESDFDTS